MDRRPPLLPALLLAILLQALWAWLHLGIFASHVLPLSFSLTLLLALWHRRAWLLWSVAAASLATAAVEIYWMQVPGLSARDSGVQGAMFCSRLTNIGITAAVVHLVLVLNRRLRLRAAEIERLNAALSQSNSELSASNEELAAREEEISRQNEELSSQSEELSQQNEELQTQRLEMEHQSEELQTHAAELQQANDELRRRETMLRLLADAVNAGSEREVLTRVCRAALNMFGGDARAAAVVETVGDRLVLQSGVGFDESAETSWPLENSFASMVMAKGKTGYIEDLALRPDLQVHQPSAGAQLRSVMASPLRVREQIIGAIKIYSSGPRQWTSTEFEIIEWVAAQCSLILETMRLQSELRTSEAGFRQLADTIPQLAWIADATGAIRWYNRRWYDYTGRTEKEMEGWGWQSVHDPAMLPTVIERWKNALTSGEPFEEVFPLRSKSGEYRLFLTRALPLKDTYGRVVQWIGTNTDVDEIKRVEAALRQASTAKDQFLAVLSHELRNPLNAVLTTASLLQSDSKLEPETRAQVAVICRNAELEARLIDDLLDVTRIEKGKISLDRRMVDIATIVRQAIEVCRGDIDSKGLKLEVNAAGSYQMMGDPARLEQIFWNVIRNAVKFTMPGGKVSIRCWEEMPGSVSVEVADTGIGFDPEAGERLFNAFEQAGENTTRLFGGLGLGLTISKSLTHLHGGTIDARSDGRGKGAVFTVRLPLTAGAQVTDGISPKSPADGWSQAPLKILLVEDHTDTLKVMERILKVHKHEVSVASSVAAALDLVKKQQFDLVLSDLGLPDGSGVDLIQAMRSKGLTMPAIALSGFGQPSDVEQTRAAGFMAHLVKPVSMGKLWEAIAELMDGQPGNPSKC